MSEHTEFLDTLFHLVFLLNLTILNLHLMSEYTPYLPQATDVTAVPLFVVSALNLTLMAIKKVVD